MEGKPSKSLTSLTITEALGLLKNKEISSVELLEAHLDGIEEKNKETNSFITITQDLARKQAKESDERIAKGEMRLLEGIPIGVKDLFCTDGFLTTAGSAALSNFVPNYESTVTRNMFANGGICVGKTNMDEFAMGSTNEYSYYGPVINTLRDKRDESKKLVPGGSSGGSAAAVLSGTCLGALGSDTGGSIRQPASFCGLVGLKPTYGSCSRSGMISFASSLDQAAVITRSVSDAAILLMSIAGHDEMDPTSINRSYENLNPETLLSLGSKCVKGLKVGIPKEYVVDGIDPEILKAWDRAKVHLKENGAEIVDISLPNTKSAISIYLIIAPAEMSSNLARYDGARFGYRSERNINNFTDMTLGSRSEAFGAEVKRRMLIGTFVLSAEEYNSYYDKAQRVRRVISNEFDAAFQKVDVILAPTTPSTAFPLGEGANDPVKMYANDVFTTPASMAGLPAISVPFGLDDTNGLPIGMQLIGPRFREDIILKVAKSLEKPQ